MQNNETAIVTREEQDALMKGLDGLGGTRPKKSSERKEKTPSTEAKRAGLIEQLEEESDPRIIEAMLAHYKKLKGRT